MEKILMKYLILTRETESHSPCQNRASEAIIQDVKHYTWALYEDEVGVNTQKFLLYSCNQAEELTVNNHHAANG